MLISAHDIVNYLNIYFYKDSHITNLEGYCIRSVYVPTTFVIQKYASYLRRCVRFLPYTARYIKEHYSFGEQ